MRAEARGQRRELMRGGRQRHQQRQDDHRADQRGRVRAHVPTPTLAKIAVSAAKPADRSAQNCQEAIGPVSHTAAPAVTDVGTRPRGALTPARGRTIFAPELGEPRQGAERPPARDVARRGDPPNLIQLMLA